MKILYHANCTDGAGAALAAWLMYRQHGNEYIPVQYGHEPPDVSGCDVLIVDFSYPRDVLIEMSKTAISIRVFDHHKTAEKDLFEIEMDLHCPSRIVFDMERSGAVITWSELHSAEVPRLLKIIQDRDLWKFEFPETKDVCAGLQLCIDWRRWNEYIKYPKKIKTLRRDGRVINEFLYIQSDKITDGNEKIARWNITGHDVPVYNLPGFMLSDTLHMALEKHPSAPYAVGYFELRGKRIYSLRSRQGSSIDVAEIAAQHGGGGHKHAAGFAVDIS